MDIATQTVLRGGPADWLPSCWERGSRAAAGASSAAGTSRGTLSGTAVPSEGEDWPLRSRPRWAHALLGSNHGGAARGHCGFVRSALSPTVSVKSLFLSLCLCCIISILHIQLFVAACVDPNSRQEGLPAEKEIHEYELEDQHCSVETPIWKRSPRTRAGKSQ